MLNRAAKKRALDSLNKVVAEYEKKAQAIEKRSVRLYELRQEAAVSIIRDCESYLSQLANAPRELSTSIGALKTELASFRADVELFEKEAHNAAVKAGGTVAAGVVGGVGLAAFGPKAALAIATTFGKASTGAAISSLSGAAATNAALAWLGGGALAAKGGGMAAGKALLAMAGPVGWAIGGISLVMAGGITRSKNKRIAEEATEKVAVVYEQVQILTEGLQKLTLLLALTTRHKLGVEKQLKYLIENAPSDYARFTRQDKERLGSLINNVNSLSASINQRIDIGSPDEAGGTR